MPRIALMGAMQEELSAVLALMQDARCETVAGRQFWLGHLNGHTVVAVLSGIGKVAAAITATVLIEKYQVQSMLFTGVAGGLARHVKVGDVVVGVELLQHDMDASPLFPPYEVPLLGRARFQTDQAMTQCLIESAAQALPHAQVHAGLIVSGDQFVSSASASQRLQANISDALAVEMEGAALAQVCFAYGIPLAVVRTLSDRADDDAHTDFTQFVKDVASPYSAAIVSEFLKRFTSTNPVGGNTT
ncbi:MAG: 5'-methylthioadenosine/adenosylhomocysteine nucleosidase [Burkholderiales bacterium]|nr:5'-methylthioadenosine/adenosylhomocysteine nucleosidase [Burkholderiales bacterium]